MKVSFGIGNWAQGNYCLVITQANNFSITLFHMPNCQFPIPKYNFLLKLLTKTLQYYYYPQHNAKKC